MNRALAAARALGINGARALGINGARALGINAAHSLGINGARILCIYFPDNPAAAVRLGRALARRLYRDLDLLDDVARVVELHLDLDRDRALASSLAAARARDVGLTVAVTRARADAVDLVAALMQANIATGTHARGRAQRKASRVAPAADRPRHAEEYRSELWDLAQAGAGRLAQLGYALRQVRSAPRTGLTLRSPRRQGATP